MPTTSPTSSSGTSAAFGKSAKWYDLLYGDRDFTKPAREVAKHYGGYHSPPYEVANWPLVVEWGAGTGLQAVALAKIGFRVEGIEPCAAMRAAADRKGLTFFDGNLLTGRTGRRPADAAVALFGSLCYAALNVYDLNRCLNSLYDTVRLGGLVAFDFIHAHAATCKLQKSCRVNTKDQAGAVSLVRKMERHYHADSSVVTTDFEFEEFNDQGKSIDRWQEQHKMRAFTPMELRFALEEHGFESIIIESAEQPPLPLTQWDWYGLAIARKHK